MNKNRNILIIIIYLSFISLGLPDGVLGVAWPEMRSFFGLPLERVSVITTILLCMSAFSSIISGKLIAKYKTSSITLASCVLTGVSLFGYAIAPSFLWLIILTVPLGLGQGAVDSALNLHVAQRYSSKHMSWLHCFWGLGASLGPAIMTRALANNWGYKNGYIIISIMQLSLAAILLFSIFKKIWVNGEKENIEDENTIENSLKDEKKLHTKFFQGIELLLFFIYSGIEFSIGIWINSVLLESRQMDVSMAGMSVSIYYMAIMGGRFLSGVLVNKIGNVKMIRLGLFIAFIGVVAGFSNNNIVVLGAVFLIGLGIAPIYPCLMHETPRRFKKSVSEKLIGYQVGAACLGGSIITAGVGIILSRISLELIFPVVGILLIFIFIANELLDYKAKDRTAKNS